MDLFTIILMAIGLSMDAFAVSVSSGLTIPNVKFKHALKIALTFGLFQAIMPVIGWFAASRFSNYITDYDHWIAFILLCIIGGKMLYEAFDEKEDKIDKDPTKLSSLLILGVATSIDALAVGVNFAFINTSIVTSVIYIGVITFFVSMVGVYFGKKFGELYSKKAEIFGGTILIGIGIKILVEHLFL